MKPSSTAEKGRRFPCAFFCEAPSGVAFLAAAWLLPPPPPPPPPPEARLGVTVRSGGAARWLSAGSRASSLSSRSMGDICSPRAPAGMRVVAFPPLAALAAWLGLGSGLGLGLGLGVGLRLRLRRSPLVLWRRTGACASSSRDRRARSLRSAPPCGLAVWDCDWDWDWEAEAPCLRGDLCGAGGSWLPWLPPWLPPPSAGRLRRCTC